jgi:putative SOS response-associated peptidase YedK
LFGFLTTEANAVVAPIDPKAMPVILRSQDEADRWLEADTPDALALQRPLPHDALRIVAKGEKEDAPLKADRDVCRLNQGRWARQGPRLADFGC